MASRQSAAVQQGRKVQQFILYATWIGSLLLTPLSAAAQTVQNRTAHIVEWDLPAKADASPGAMVVDTDGDNQNRIWFLTRTGAPQRAFRFDPSKSLTKGNAQWKSWQLADENQPPSFTGGVKKIKASKDRRFIFVRTTASLVRVDTQNCAGNPQTCERTRWADQDDNSFNVSDLAVDDRNNVFTTNAVDLNNPASSYLQMLTPGPAPASGMSTVSVTRWNVGGGAGFCPTAVTSGPCVSGIAVHPSNRNLIYYSEPTGSEPNSADMKGNIAELNISTSGNNVRRWSLAKLSRALGAGIDIHEPRQLNIDRWGIVWVVTGSGHLVNLDPVGNKMGGHQIPFGDANDPFGVAPDDDVVGYTASGLNKVGMLIPKRGTVPVTASSARINPGPFPVDVFKERAIAASGFVPPDGKVVQAFITTNPDGDVFVEAQLDTNSNNPMNPNDSTSPLGITPNKGKGQGTFFYAVGANMSSTTDPQTGQMVAVDRVGFVRLPMPQKVKHPRDDDDAEDGWDHNSHPAGWHTSAANDDDADGLENAFDLPNAREDVQVVDGAPAIAGGQSADFPVTTSPTTLALIATATADDPLAQIGVEIYDALGLLVATSAPSLGVAVATVPLPAASTYTARIRNYGMTPITHTPRLIVREPWLP
jgi:streptogramin lyase